MTLLRPAALSAAVLVAVTAAGCSDPYAGRQAVAGKVTLEGQPLSDAYITFEPLERQSTAGGASVANGTYQIDRKDGLMPGRYIVRITAGDGVTPAGDEEAGGPGGGTNILSADRVPEDWNVASKQEVVVKDGGGNTFDFTIPKAVDTKAKRKKN